MTVQPLENHDSSFVGSLTIRKWCGVVQSNVKLWHQRAGVSCAWQLKYEADFLRLLPEHISHLFTAPNICKGRLEWETWCCCFTCFGLNAKTGTGYEYTIKRDENAQSLFERPWKREHNLKQRWHLFSLRPISLNKAVFSGGTQRQAVWHDSRPYFPLPGLREQLFWALRSLRQLFHYIMRRPQLCKITKMDILTTCLNMLNMSV